MTGAFAAARRCCAGERGAAPRAAGRSRGGGDRLLRLRARARGGGPRRATSRARRPFMPEVADRPLPLDRRDRPPRAARRAHLARLASPTRRRAQLRDAPARRAARAAARRSASRGAIVSTLERAAYLPRARARLDYIARGRLLPGEPHARVPRARARAIRGPSIATCTTRIPRRWARSSSIRSAPCSRARPSASWWSRAARRSRGRSRARAGGAPIPRRTPRAAPSSLASAKDRAENVMIVDLLRNDFGARVRDRAACEVPGLCELESFATVHHLVRP